MEGLRSRRILGKVYAIAVFLLPQFPVFHLPQFPVFHPVCGGHSESCISIYIIFTHFQRTLRSSRSTDAKSSEAPVVDDVIQPSNRSPSKQRVKKKARDERERELSRLSFGFDEEIEKLTVSWLTLRRP